MSYIAWFKDIDKDSIETVGGKGANLGEMWNNRFPVPSGFVVTAQTYRMFIRKTKIDDKIRTLLKNMSDEDTQELQKRADEIQKLVQSTTMPRDMQEAIAEAYETLSLENKTKAEKVVKSEEEFVAVRSSATAEDLPTASFAGQQSTFLNIKGNEKVVDAVKECWASLFTARAIYYRQKNNFSHEKVLIAVVVQRMVNSDKAGVMFTINPATNNREEIVIEAALGLGELVVSGSVNPDTYILEKSTLKTKKFEQNQQKIKLVRDPVSGGNREKHLTAAEQKLHVLNDKELHELARYGKKIEQHYGAPQDIEWAIEKDRLCIVQSRAITTIKKEELQKENEQKIDPSKKTILLRGQTASAGTASGPVRIVKDASELYKVKKGDILVTRMTNPDMVPGMEKAAAIITDEGGMTSHAAIVSREMGVPCIVGAQNATIRLKDYQIVTVHATAGIVYEGNVTIKEEKKEMGGNAHKKCETQTKIKVIMDFPNRAQEIAQKTDADGVGLLRLEFIIASGNKHPAQYIRENKDNEYTALLVQEVGKVAHAFRNKPVWARCSDLRSDEYRNLAGGDKEPHESDPMIGWHGIRRLLDEPRILKAEFMAVKQLHEQGLKNVGIMLPFVIRADEIQKAKEILREVGLEPHKDVKFGVMIETPAACWIIEDMCKVGIDFASFGTNDLTQTTLGIDRNNQRIQKLFDEMHPAVLGEIAMVIKVCKRYGVETSICGQAASKPEMAEFLVKMGIDSVSPNPDAVHMIRETVGHAEQEREKMKNVQLRDGA